jgi:hypothetical protein
MYIRLCDKLSQVTEGGVVASWRVVAGAPRPPAPHPQAQLPSPWHHLSRNHLPSSPRRQPLPKPTSSLSRRRAPCLPLPPRSPPRPRCFSPAAGSRGFSSSRSAHPPSPPIAPPPPPPPHPPPLCGSAASPGRPCLPPSPPLR